MSLLPMRLSIADTASYKEEWRHEWKHAFCRVWPGSIYKSKRLRSTTPTRVYETLYSMTCIQDLQGTFAPLHDLNQMRSTSDHTSAAR